MKTRLNTMQASNLSFWMRGERKSTYSTTRTTIPFLPGENFSYSFWWVKYNVTETVKWVQLETQICQVTNGLPKSVLNFNKVWPKNTWLVLISWQLKGWKSIEAIAKIPWKPRWQKISLKACIVLGMEKSVYSHADLQQIFAYDSLCLSIGLL